jgi:MFS family permease
MTLALPIGWFPRVLLVNFLLAVTMQGMRPMVSYRALALGATPTDIGLITACFGILSLLIAVPAGRWVDRLGEGAFMAAGTALIAILALVLVTSDSLITLGLVMLGLGAGQIVAAVSIQTLIANGGAPEGRDGRFGTQTVVASFGQFIGPAAAGFVVASAISSGQTGVTGVPLGATDGVFALGAITGLCACLVGLTLWRWPPRQHPRHVAAAAGTPRSTESTLAAVGRVMRVPSIPQAMLASLTVLSCIDILTVYLPVYGEANGIPVETVGLLLAVRGGSSMTARALMLPLMRLLGRRYLLIGSMVVPAIALVVLPLAGPSIGVLAVAVALIGFGLGMCQPLTMTWVATQSPAEIRGTAIGVRLSANRFGQFAIPAIAGLAAGAAGLTLIFWSLGALLAISAAFVTRGAFSPPGGGSRATDELPKQAVDP